MIAKLPLKEASRIGLTIRFVLSEKLLELPSDLCTKVSHGLKLARRIDEQITYKRHNNRFGLNRNSDEALKL